MISVLTGPNYTADEVDQRIADDPRFSKAQLDAIRKAALPHRDRRASFVGLDARMRPVIEARLNGPGRTRWAILRNGDPAKVLRPMVEAWR